VGAQAFVHMHHDTKGHVMGLGILHLPTPRAKSMPVGGTTAQQPGWLGEDSVGVTEGC
jgi:hypothetical protein